MVLDNDEVRIDTWRPMDDALVKEKNPLGKGEWVGLVHDPQRGLEAHREAETHIWGGDCWVTRVSEVPHWIKMRRMSC